MTAATSAVPSAPGARHATLEDLAALLRDQQARKVDIVAPAAAIRAQDARLVVDGTEPVLDPDGVTAAAGAYVPTDVCDQGVADSSASRRRTCGSCVSRSRTCTTRT
jgi:hypothetical protein